MERTLPALRPLLIVVYGLAIGGLLLTGSAFAPPDTTAPTVTGSAPLTVVAAGDLVCGPALEPGPGECVDVSPLAADADVVLILGDVTYPVGAAEEYAAYDATWGRWLNKTLAVPGNHEYHQPGAGPFYSYFEGRTSSAGYFAVDLAGWRLYALNTVCKEIDCAAERRWLAELVQTDPGCSIAFGHHPLHSSYKSEDVEPVGPFYELLADAEVILAGHAHVYERFDQQVIVGTGGRSIYEPDEIEAGSRALVQEYGVLRLTLHPGHYAAEFVTLDGEVADAFNGTC